MQTQLSPFGALVVFSACSVSTAGLAGPDGSTGDASRDASRAGGALDGSPTLDARGELDTGPPPDDVDASPSDRDAGPTPGPGCVPAGWSVVFEDHFDGDLTSWDLDSNIDASTTFWRIEDGRLHGRSTNAGTDVAARRADGDVAVIARMDVTSRAGASGVRAAGPFVRATSIDFATNRFYACLVDPGGGEIILARFDDASGVGSGQGFTELARDAATVPTGALDVIVCARGSSIACDVPATGIHLESTDSMFASGAPGLRVMRADALVDSFAVFAP